MIAETIRKVARDHATTIESKLRDPNADDQTVLAVIAAGSVVQTLLLAEIAAQLAESKVNS